MRIIVAAIVATCLFIVQASQATADLLEMYLQNDSSPTRGEISYGFGASIPAPYGKGKGGDVIKLSAGLKKNKGCGFSFAGEVKAIFSKEMLDQYVSGLVGSITSGAPLLLLCYASQTLCDLYKHYRAMANAALRMKQASCQQVEALAMKAGSSLRNNRIMECISENMGEIGYDAAVEKCGNITDPDINVPGSAEYKTEFDLGEALAKAGTDNPDLQNFIKGVVGDVRFSGSFGIYTGSKTKYGLEGQISDLTNKYYDAIKDVGEGYRGGGGCPDGDTLSLVSTPGNPITCLILSRVALLDPQTRDNFYRQYATVAAMTAILYKIEDAVDALERAKAAAKDKDSIEKLKDTINDLERRYSLVERRLALQKDYLNPMMLTLLQYQTPPRTPDITEEEIGIYVPKSIQKK